MAKPAQVELVGRKIRQLRRQRKLTQVELAERIGIHQSDLSRMEQGEYKVGLDTLFKILQVFDLKMGEFFGETETLAEPETKDLVKDFRELSNEAQREVRDFVRFKRMQEQEHPPDGKPDPGWPGQPPGEKTS